VLFIKTDKSLLLALFVVIMFRFY